MISHPLEPKLLTRRPVAVDRWIDQQLFPRARRDMGRGERVARDVLHFGVSLASEITGVLGATPGFVRELWRSGVYPEFMRFRKLPFRPEMSDLTVLRESNPEWTFRPDFDPKNWVFVFLHGYVDNTGADRVAYKLASLGYQVYMVCYPFLRGVESLAEELREVLEQIADLEPKKRIVPIGHSLGGCVWDHLLLHAPELVGRYEMPLYIPLGSPHFGTFAAHIGLGASARDMMPKSAVMNDHLGRDFPESLEIYPFVSRFDLLVLPIETALLKRGINYILSETGHIAQVIRSETVTAIEEIIASPKELLEERAELRPFYPSNLAWLLGHMPKVMLRSLGVEGILQYINGDNGSPPEFRLRVVHHELGQGIFPALRRPT